METILKNPIVKTLERATLTSIKPINALPLNYENKVVSSKTSVYKLSSRTGSAITKPAAFVPSESPKLFRTTLTLKEATQATEYVLNGKLNGEEQIFSGRAVAEESGSCEISITVGIDKNLEGFVALNSAAIEWTLSVKGEDAPLYQAVIPMEIYFLPKNPSHIFHRGLHLETLRKFSQHLESSKDVQLVADGATLKHQNVANAAWTIQECVNSAFFYNPPKYDSYYGANYYTTIHWGADITVTLYYARWYNAHSTSTSLENCYDMASIEQYILSLVGGYQLTDIKWAYMNPFGYLAQTDLIGRGQCNNPFYLGSGGPIIIGQTNPARTAFGNHAFLRMPTLNIVDACAGPHYGTETAAQYVSAATDGTYPNPPSVRRGTVNDISYNTGVTSVNNTSSIKVSDVMHNKENTEKFKTAVAYNSLDKGVRSIVSKIPVWKSPTKCKALAKGWKIGYEELIPGYPETIKFWQLKKQDEAVDINVYIANDGPEAAHNRFLNIGSTYTTVDPIFKESPKGLGEASAQNSDGTRLLWVSGSIVFDIESRNSDVNLRKIAAWLQKQLEGGSRKSIKELNITSLDVSSKSLIIDEEVTIDVNAKKNSVIDFRPHEGLILVSHDKNTLTFRAIKSSKGALTIIAVDPKTGQSTIDEVVIVVK